MKGFTKDGKFRPTEKRTKSGLKKSDLKKKHWEPVQEYYFGDKRKRTKQSLDEEHEIGTKWCSGKHKCQICGKKFDCTGTGYGHDSKFSESQCHGAYEQFCENHTVEEYTKKHKELGELDKKSLDKKSVDALGTPNDEVDHEELFNESDHDFVDYMSEGQIEDIANDYLYSLSKDMTQHDKLKALQSYLNGEFGSNPADEANLNSLANNLVFQEDLEKFEKEEHARYLEEEKFYKENNTSEAEEHEKYFKEHPDEARQKNSLGWKKMTPDERYENITRDYYIMLDNERQPVEFFDEADELASSERNMDAVVDYAMEIAEQDEPPQDLAKHIRKMKGRSDTK